MGDAAKPYTRAVRIKASASERFQDWNVYHYRKVKRGDYWYAEPRKRGVNDLTQDEWYSRQGFIKKRKRTRGELERFSKEPVFDFEYELSHQYSPLLEEPTLFLNFSQLADDEDVSVGEWFEWIETYGVLGMNDRADVYSNFVDEALLASRIRRLFEAAIEEPKPNVNVLMQLIPMVTHSYSAECEIAFKKPGDAEGAALQIIGNTIERKIYEECAPALLIQPHYRSSRRSPLRQSWWFQSLLGAMWLQFMWGVETHKIQHCVVCGRRIPKDKYRSAMHCSNACKQQAMRERNRIA